LRHPDKHNPDKLKLAKRRPVKPRPDQTRNMKIRPKPGRAVRIRNRGLGLSRAPSRVTGQDRRRAPSRFPSRSTTWP
jgi:hypothetical protein